MLNASNPDVEELVGLAKRYESLQKYDEAIQIYRHILILSPKNETALSRIRTITNSVSHTQKFSEPMDKNQTPSVSLSPTKSAISTFAPYSNVSEKEVKKNTGMRKKIKKRSVISKKQNDSQIIAEGYKAIDEDRWNDAFAQFNTILKRQPKNTLALYGNALVYAHQQQWDKVRKTLARAAAIHNDPKIYALYTQALEHLGSTKAQNNNENTFIVKMTTIKQLITQNSLTEAENALQELYLQTPSNIDILLRLGEVYSRQGEFSKAKEYYESVLTFAPDNFYALYGLAQTYYALCNYQSALTTYEQIDRKKWDAALTYNYKMAQIGSLIQTNNYTKAQQLTEDLFKKDPENLEVLRELALISEHLKSSNAIRYRTVVYQKSGRTDDLIALLYALLNLERFTQTETYFNTLKDKTFSSEELSELKNLYLVYYHKLSSQQLSLKHFDAAERTARSGLLLAPNDPTLKENLAWSLLNQKRPADALLIFEQLLASNPSNRLYYASAVSAYNAKNTKKSYGYLFKASKTTDVELLKKIAELYKNMGYSQEALDTIKLVEDYRNNRPDLMPHQEKSLPEETSKPSETNDLNGIYNPFLPTSLQQPENLPIYSEKDRSNEQEKSFLLRNSPSVSNQQKQSDTINDLKQQILSKKQSSASGGFFFENRSGKRGIDRLTKTVIPLEATLTPSFDDTLHTGINIIHLQTGKLSDSDRSFLGYGTNTGNHNIEALNGFEPFIKYTKRVDTSLWEGKIATTPINSSIASTPTGYLRSLIDRNSWHYSIQFLRQPVTETLLSYTGQKDPNSGQAWGRITRSGIEASISSSDDWIKSLSIGYYPHISGINTIENSESKMVLFTGTKLIDTPSHELLTGPLFVYDRYRHSTNHFTFGHGGYFSPTSYQLLSLYGDYTGNLDTQTYLRLKGNIGFSSFQESSEPIFPLANSSAQYSSSSTSGFSANFKGYLGYKIDSHLHLLGFLGWSDAPQYRFFSTGATLIYYFDDLAPLHPNELIRNTYAWDNFL